MPDVENLHYDDLSAVATLVTTERYQCILEATRQALADDEAGTSEQQAWSGPTEDDPTYK